MSKSYVCPNCNKVFKHQPNLSRHINGSIKSGVKPCQAVVSQVTTESDNSVSLRPLQNQITLLTQEVTELKAQNADLQTQNATLLSQIAEFKAQKESQICHIPQEETQENDRILHQYDNSDYCGVNTRNDYPLPFASEEQIIQLIKKTQPYKIFGTLLKLFHFNDDYPEYWNVCIKNKSHLSKISFWDGTEWCECRLAEFVENHIRKLREMIDNFYIDDKDEALVKALEEVELFLDEEVRDKTKPYDYLRSILLDDEILSKVRKYHGFKSK